MNLPKELKGTIEDQETFKTAMETIEDEVQEMNNKLKLMRDNFMTIVNDLNARLSLMEAGKQ